VRMFDCDKIRESFRSHCSRLRGAEASQMMEFAVALPLLVVLVIGIFDFGTAFNLKQELNNAVREGARFASTQPTNDLCPTCSTPPSVDAIRFVVDSYLQASAINDCGLSTLSEPGAGSGLIWTYTATGNGCPSGHALTLTIARGVALAATNYGNANVNIMSTQVTISYPYQWRFNRVITLLAPGANYAGVSQIKTDASAVNMN